MSYRGFATTVAALVVPLAVTVTWRSPSPPKPLLVTSSTASVPAEARDWLEGPKGATRAIDLGAYCRDVLASPEPPGLPLTPAPDLDRLTKDAAARLAFRRNLRLRGTPLEDVRLGIGLSSDFPVPEIMLRAVPFEALVAYDPGSYTRVYALSEPLDVAVDRLRERVEAVAPRVACAINPNHMMWSQTRYTRAKLEGFERVVDVLVPTNSCEPGSYFSVRLFRRGDVTWLVGAGGKQAFENERWVDVEDRVVAALAR